MKCDAFDQIDKLKKLDDQIHQKIKELRNATEVCEDDYKVWLSRFKTELSDMDTEKQCFQLSIAKDSSILQEVSNHLGADLSLKSTLCDPNSYEMKSSPKGEYCKILISGLRHDPFKPTLTSLLKVTIERKTGKETFTIRHLLNEGKAHRIGSKEIVYPVKVHSSVEFKVSVEVLGKDIVSSPIIVRKSECNEKSEFLDFFSGELDNQYEKQECSTYYCRILV